MRSFDGPQSHHSVMDTGSYPDWLLTNFSASSGDGAMYGMGSLILFHSELIKNKLLHLGHLRITPVLGALSWNSCTLTCSPAGQSHRRPRLQIGQRT